MSSARRESRRGGPPPWRRRGTPASRGRGQAGVWWTRRSRGARGVALTLCRPHSPRRPPTTSWAPSRHHRGRRPPARVRRGHWSPMWRRTTANDSRPTARSVHVPHTCPHEWPPMCTCGPRTPTRREGGGGWGGGGMPARAAGGEGHESRRATPTVCTMCGPWLCSHFLYSCPFTRV